MIELAVLPLGRDPAFPAKIFVENETIFLTLQLGFVSLVLFQPIEILQKKEPGGLLGIVQLSGAASLFPEDIVDVFESLLKHAEVLRATR